MQGWMSTSGSMIVSEWVTAKNTNPANEMPCQNNKKRLWKLTRAIRFYVQMKNNNPMVLYVFFRLRCFSHFSLYILWFLCRLITYLSDCMKFFFVPCRFVEWLALCAIIMQSCIFMFWMEKSIIKYLKRVNIKVRFED